jgi:hypothetical protein
MTVHFCTFSKIRLTHTVTTEMGQCRYDPDRTTRCSISEYGSHRTNRWPRVLLVDDDDGVRDMMTATLEGQLAAIRVSLGGPQSWSKTSTLPS